MSIKVDELADYIAPLHEQIAVQKARIAKLEAFVAAYDAWAEPVGRVKRNEMGVRMSYFDVVEARKALALGE